MKEVIKELAEKAREAVSNTRVVSGQREMTWIPEAFEEKFFQLATEWQRNKDIEICRQVPMSFYAALEIKRQGENQ